MRREFHVRFCERAAVGLLRATHLANADRLKGDGAAPRRGDGQRDAALADKIEPVRRLALMKKMLAFFEAHVLGAAADKLDKAFVQTCEKSMLPDDALKPFHSRLLQRASVSRMARTSSVMSIPTGHHVMQRP